MKKVLLALFIYFNFATAIFANKTDIYFSNGILTIERDAIENSLLLKNEIKERLYNGASESFEEDINKISYAYNQTKGFFYDVIESGLQKLLPESPDAMRVWASSLMNATEKSDLSEQLEAYKQSHSNGNKILIVAHSQGNLFANRINAALFNPDYLHIIHIAAPTDEFTSEDVVGWDNDLVAWGGFWHDTLTECNVRKVAWTNLSPQNITPSFKPFSEYMYKEQIDTFDKSPLYTVREPYLLGHLNSLVHAFTFYMGQPLKEDLFNNTSILPLVLQKPTSYKKIPNAIDGGDLIDTQARDKILEYIQIQLATNSNTPDPDTGGGTDTNTTTNPDTNTTTTPTEFDYKNACNDIAFPDPIPTELETSINDIITTAGDSIAAPIVCPLIDAAVTAYNLTNGGDIPSPF